MKVIDLLNKIANKEELPEVIECYNQIFYLSDNLYIAKFQKGKYLDNYIDLSSLDYEVKIIEDTPISKLYVNNKLQYVLTPKYVNNELQYDLTPKEDKKIEKIKDYRIFKTMGLDCKYNERKEPKNYSLEEKEIVDKINEIIDKINKGE